MKITNAADFYKTGHHLQYPENTQMVYSNFTPRVTRIPGINGVVVFGVQAFIQKYLVEEFATFFNTPKASAVAQYSRRLKNALGAQYAGAKHFEALHDLGYLPLEIKALAEGTVCPLRVPMLTIKNTHPRFFWVTNWVETLLSNSLWHPMTSATIAREYRKILDEYASLTSDAPEFVQWQGHDFSMRGQTCLEAASASGAAHLLSFTGTDTITAIDYLEKYYGANSDNELVGGSVPATEHSVMCMGGKDTERDTYARLITQVYPSGVVSIVSDTWDYWQVLDTTVRSLKNEIIARDGKVVIRPDSGNPADILCGDPASINPLAQKGTIQLLWEIFGGTINAKGYKQLDPHIGAIYGDSITLEVCRDVCERLAKKGFASTNVVFGIGSYTYQYVTRDTFGFAVKATYGIINNNPVELFKDPATDKSGKKSAKGLLMVDEQLMLHECVTPLEEQKGMLKTVFLNGNAERFQTLAQIRKRLAK